MLNRASIFISSLFIIGSTAAIHANTEVQTKVSDRTSIIKLINEVGTLADLQEYDQLEQLFTDKVTVDYTSLFPGKAQDMSSKQLMSQWQSTLSGFDATEHEISNHQIIIDGNKAKAIASVRATHTLDNEYWVLGGYYVDELVRTEDGWKISAIQHNTSYEEGEPALLDKAAAIVAKRAKKQ